MEALGLAPRSITELKNALNQLTENSKIIAGGTDLIISLYHGNSTPDKLLYIGGVKELVGISLNDETLSIGACTTMAEIADNEALNKHFSAISDSARDVGSKQIRNNATIGGNIANASPAADLLPSLWLFGAKVEILSPKGFEIIPLSDFILGPERTVLDFNHVITRFIIEKPLDEPLFSAFVKVGSRRKVTISRLGLSMSYNPKNHDCKIVLGAVAPTPIFADDAQYTLSQGFEKESLPTVANQLTELILEINKRKNRLYKSWAVKGGIEDAFLMIKERSQ